MTLIGIDTGVHTGLAFYDTDLKALKYVKEYKIHRAMDLVKRLWDSGEDIKVRFEDARKRTWFGHHTAKEDRARLQGAGSVKRDCQIWEDYLTDLGIPFEMVAPKNNATKLTAEQFRRITGYEGKTNEHGRDAAMLVYGY
jgi:hypothetical protein